MRIRYSELFSSMQGEAGYAGMPSIWLRFFGCNLNCDGFGQPDPTDPTTYQLPYKEFDTSKVQLITDLPVFNRGCDSGYSWSSRFKHLAYDASAKDVAQQMLRMADEELGCTNWTHRVLETKPQLCFTGGEPMMQQKQMLAILRELHESTGCFVPQITIETNGTKKVDFDTFDQISSLTDHVHFAISPKLFSVSGEQGAVKMSVIEDYCTIADTVAMKFVINGSKQSWHELEGYEQQLTRLPKYVTLYVMPVGATKEDQELPVIAEIANEAMRRGYHVATRNHVSVYGNSMNT